MWRKRMLNAIASAAVQYLEGFQSQFWNAAIIANEPIPNSRKNSQSKTAQLMNELQRFINTVPRMVEEVDVGGISLFGICVLAVAYQMAAKGVRISIRGQEREEARSRLT